jgi:hypothetical protein
MKVDKRGYAYLGKKYADSEFVVNDQDDGNMVLLERVVKVPAKHAWFYSEEWQKGEKDAQKNIDAGNVETIDDVDKYVSGILDAKKKPKNRRSK